MLTFNQYFLDNCSRVGPSATRASFNITLSIMFLILNIAGNLLVILAVVINPYKNLRTPFNYLVVNLAVADLIMGVVAYPLVIAAHIQRLSSQQATTTEVLSAIYISGFTSCTASVLNLSAIAVERYLAVSDPHTYRSKLTGKRIFVTLSCIWTISLFLPFINLTVDPRTYAFIHIHTTVAVSVGIMAFTYAMMLKKYKRNPRNQKGTDSADVDVYTPSSASSSVLHDNAAQLEYKITAMFLVVMIAMLCSYGPAAILFYVMNFCRSCSCTTLHWLEDIGFFLLVLNSNVNFFCYAFRSSRFRTAFFHILRIKRNYITSRGLTNTTDTRV